MTRRRAALLLALIGPALTLSGCGLISGSSSSSSASSSATGDDASGGGESWIVGEQGKATPSPTPKAGGTPSPSVSFGFLPLTGGAPGYRTPSPTCSSNTFNFSRVDGLDVTPSRTGATLSWYNVGGGNLVEFRLYAISQDLVVGRQRDIGYTVVKPRTPCGQMSAVIGDLSPQTQYVFSVDAVVIRRSGDGTHSATVFRSGSVRTR